MCLGMSSRMHGQHESHSLSRISMLLSLYAGFDYGANHSQLSLLRRKRQWKAPSSFLMCAGLELDVGSLVGRCGRFPKLRSNSIHSRE